MRRREDAVTQFQQNNKREVFIDLWCKSANFSLIQWTLINKVSLNQKTILNSQSLMRNRNLWITESHQTLLLALLTLRLVSISSHSNLLFMFLYCNSLFDDDNDQEEFKEWEEKIPVFLECEIKEIRSVFRKISKGTQRIVMNESYQKRVCDHANHDQISSFFQISKQFHFSSARSLRVLSKRVGDIVLQNFLLPFESLRSPKRKDLKHNSKACPPSTFYPPTPTHYYHHYNRNLCGDYVQLVNRFS